VVEGVSRGSREGWQAVDVGFEDDALIDIRWYRELCLLIFRKRDDSCTLR
jgi:hypothetical protein